MHVLPRRLFRPKTDEAPPADEPVLRSTQREAPIEPPDLSRAKSVCACLDPADVGTTVENAIAALKHAADRMERVASGSMHAYTRLHTRLRQSIAPFEALTPQAIEGLSPEARGRAGVRLGAELARVLDAFPRAIATLESEGKSGKAHQLDLVVQRLLETLAEKLDAVPIASPEVAKLLGDPPRLDGDNAMAILEKLKLDLDGHDDGELTTEHRLAALFLTDAIADELRALLTARGEDPKSVDELVTRGKSRRERISLALRRGAAVAAALAIAVPGVVYSQPRDAAVDVVRDPTNVVVQTIEQEEPRPTVKPGQVHDPYSIRVTEKTDRLEEQRSVARDAIARVSEESDHPAGVPPGIARKMVIEHLDAAGFPLERFAKDGTPDPQIDPLEEAVATYQASVGLEPTGKVNLETWDRLEESIILANPKNPDFSPPQELGERSDAVKKSEQIMAELGALAPKHVDKEYGPETQRAVRQYERSHGLPVDGAMDMKVFRTMVKELVERYTSKPEVVSKPSPNHSPRGMPIDAIVLHHTASNNVAADLATLRSPAAEVSANFLIGPDGTIYELVPEDRAAWHAGEALLHGRHGNVNARSIGIEITNDGSGKTPFTPAQYRALERLVPYLVAKYDIPIENIVGHKDVAIPAGRKTDPAPNFDEERVLQAVRHVEQLQKLG